MTQPRSNSIFAARTGLVARLLACSIAVGALLVCNAAQGAVDVTVGSESPVVGYAADDLVSALVDPRQLLNELAAELAATAESDVASSGPSEPAAPEPQQPEKNPELSTPLTTLAPYSSPSGSSMGGGGGAGGGGAGPVALAPFVEHILADPLLGRLAIADTLSAPAEPVFSMLRPPRA